MASLLDTFFEAEMVSVRCLDSTRAYDGCLLFIQRWLVVNGYDSPYELLPMPYNDKSGLRVMTKRGGGILKLAENAAKRIGLQQPKSLVDLRRGDIGVVTAPHESQKRRFTILAFGIKDVKDRWAMKAENGLQFLPLKPVTGWHIEQVAT